MQSGGNGINYSLAPANYDGEGVGTSGVDLQFVAGQAGGKRRRSTRRGRSRRGGASYMGQGGARRRRTRRARKSRKSRRSRR